MRGRFAFYGEVGGKNHFFQEPVSRALHQPVEIDLLRTDTIERRQTSKQYEIQASICLRLFHHGDIARHFYDTQQPGVAPWRTAQLARLRFSKVVALFAMLNICDRLLE